MDDKQVGQQTDITGDGNVVGDGGVSQVVKAEGGGTIKNVIQAVIHMPAWAWIAGVVFLSVTALLVASIFNIGPLRNLLPTPMAFPAATEDQSLIIVADFDDRSGGKYQGIDPAQYICEKLEAQAQADGLDVRVERLHEIVNDNTARSTGQDYNATLLLWGWYDALSVTPRIERVKTLSEYISMEEEQHLSLSDPAKIEFCILVDLPSQATYLTLFTLGVHECGSKNYSQALAYLTSALAAIPEGGECSTDPSEAYFFRGNVHLYRSDYELALADYGKAIELDPELATAYNNRGVTYLDLGEYEKALVDYGKAIELDLEDAKAYLNRGTTYAVLGEYEKALADYDKAIELDPEYAYAYLNRGGTYTILGEYEKALADCDRAIELDPQDGGAYVNRGSCLVELEKLEESIQAFEQALSLGLEYHVEAYVGLGGAYLKLGDHEAALLALDKAIELDPKYFGAYINRGIVHSELNEYEKALADFTKAIELNPGDANAYYNRGLTYKKTNRVEKAIADLKRFLELSDDPYLRERAEQHLRELRGE